MENARIRIGSGFHRTGSGSDLDRIRSGSDPDPVRFKFSRVIGSGFDRIRTGSMFGVFDFDSIYFVRAIMMDVNGTLSFLNKIGRSRQHFLTRQRSPAPELFLQAPPFFLFLQCDCLLGSVRSWLANAAFRVVTLA